jgi:hypothetical protein
VRVVENEQRERVMTDRRTDPSLEDLNRGMLTAAVVLIGVGSVLGMAGLAVSGAAAVAAFRNWCQRADLPPRELARLKWEQTKKAAGAGAGAWRDTERSRYTPRGDRAER